MRKIIAITQLSLDGVMQAPGGRKEDTRGGFNLGGWFMRFADDGVMQAIDEALSTPFDLLLGRRTYDIWAGYWPRHAGNPIGQAFNRATKFVVTRKPDRLSWMESRRIGGNVVAAVRRLKSSRGPALHVWGSGKLLQTLMAAGLVDEHRLWIAPVILGQGRRLFDKGLPARGLKLVDSRRTLKGILINTYRPSKRAP